MAIVTLILLAVIFIAFLYLIKHFLEKLHLSKAIKGLPGPKTLPLLGNALMFTGEVADICTKIIGVVNTYPSASRVWLGPRLFIIIYDPKHLKVVFTSESAIHKSEDYDYMKPFVGEGLLSAPASQWRVQRKSVSPAFHMNALKTFMDAFVKHSIVFTRVLESSNGEEVEASDYIGRLAVDIIYDTMLDTDLKSQTNPDCKIVSSMKTIFETITIRMFKIWLHPNIIFFNTAIGKEQRKCTNYINGFTSEIIKKKKMELESNNVQETVHENEGEEKKPKSFMNLLVDSTKNGEDLSEKMLRDQINTMTVAGSDTTTCTIAFLFLMLGTFPEVQKKVYQELHDIYGSSDPEEILIKYNDLQHMNYLERVIKETMRLFPVAPMIIRKAVDNIQVENNQVIPKGSSIILAIVKLHRSEKYWPEPFKFDPDRFLPENISTRHPYSYIPFSGGPRNCIGGKFAMIEIKTIVATTLRKFIITIDKPVPVEEIDLKLFVVLKPGKPIMLRFKKRYCT